VATETLQVCTRDANGRYSVVLDLNDGTTNTLKSGGLVLTPPAISPTLVSSVDSDGQDSTGQVVPNGTVEVDLWVKAGSQDALATAVANAIATAYPSRGTTYYLKYRPYGATYPVFYEVVAPSSHAVPYDWHEFAYNRASLKLVFTTKPYALGEQTSTFENFPSTITLSDYWQGTGLADCSVANGNLSLTGNYGLQHTLLSRKGYTPVDGCITVKFTTPSVYTAASFKVGLIFRGQSDGLTWLEAQATNDTITLRKTVNGGTAYTDVYGSTAPCVLAANTTYYMRVWFEGVKVFIQFGNALGTAGVTGTPSAQLSVTLVTTEAAYGGGNMGMDFRPGAAGASVSSLFLEPWAYGGATNFLLGLDYKTMQNVPGDLDALMDLALDSTGGSSAWGLVAWNQPVATQTNNLNLLPNWDFETDILGWDSLNLFGLVTNPGGTLTQDGTQFKTGTKALKCVGPALANWGPEAQVCVPGRFRSGQTYTFTCWVFGAAASGTVTAVMGSSSGNSQAGTPVTLAASWQQVTVQWTNAGGDVDSAAIALKFSNASVTAWVDNVHVAVGSTIPTTSTGKPEAMCVPAVIPAAVMAAQYDPTTAAQLTAGWSLQSDILASSPVYRQYLGYTGGIPATLSASCFINPASCQPGTYGIWARVKLANTITNPTLTVSVGDEYGNGQAQYTAEYGPTGKTLPVPTTDQLWRWHFLGSMYLGNPEQARAKLTLTATAGGSGQFGIDALHVMPMSQSAMRRWDGGDTAADGFIAFQPSTNGGVLIFSNLRQNVYPASAIPPVNYGWANGAMLGSPLRLAPGTSRLYVQLLKVMPGDTNTATTSDESTGLNTSGASRWFVLLRPNFTPRYRFARGG
jgi:hypothetical protein